MVQPLQSLIVVIVDLVGFGFGGGDLNGDDLLLREVPGFVFLGYRNYVGHGAVELFDNAADGVALCFET